MRLAYISLLITLAAVGLRAGQSAQVKNDVNALQGTWLVEALEYNGNDITDKFKLSFVIKGDALIVEGDANVIKDYGRLTFKLDSATLPKTIDLKVTVGKQLDFSMEGIYELNDDQLKICVTVFGVGRPSDFQCSEGGDITLVTLKRKK
jgi:uncharacterized protein (TIGR03067 family)